MKLRLLSPAILFAVASVACSSPDEPGDTPPEVSSSPTDASPDVTAITVDEALLIGDGTIILQEAVSCEAPSSARPPLRRLSRLEYANSVRDLFGSTPGAAANVADVHVAGFTSNWSVPLSENGAETYARAAEGIAAEVAADFPARSGCASVDDTACAQSFLTMSAQSAFRGTLPDSDREALLALYSDVAASSAADALEIGIQAILLSPRFLYVVEFGAPGDGTVPLTQNEIAARLALSIWRSVPDATLLNMAAAGELGSRDAIRAQASSMLEDPRADSAFVDFIRQYLEIENLAGVTKSSDQFPNFSSLKPSLEEETHRFFKEIVRSGDIDALFNAPFTIADQQVASHYNASAPESPDVDGFGRVALPENRRGILMHGSVLARHSHPTKSSPVKLGKMIRDRVLCDPPPDPLPGVEADLPVGPGESIRDVFEAHAAAPECQGCHSLIDPLGNGFGDFDASGRFIGNADASGTIVAPARAATPDIGGDFNGALELTQKLSDSEHIAQCYSLQVFRYMIGRAESSPDACAYQQALEQFAGSGKTLREAILGVVTSDAFLYRPSVNAGGSCL